jgi:hypothetical protein
MSSPAKRSELAEQIELARRSIDRWPGWLKDAAGVQNTDSTDSKSSSQPAGNEQQKSLSDPQD